MATNNAIQENASNTATMRRNFNSDCMFILKN